MAKIDVSANRKGTRRDSSGHVLVVGDEGEREVVAASQMPGEVILTRSPDRPASRRKPTAEHKDVHGRYRVTSGPTTLVSVETALSGERVAVPYLNFYVANGVVVVPVCGHAADVDMLAIIAEHIVPEYHSR